MAAALRAMLKAKLPPRRRPGGSSRGRSGVRQLPHLRQADVVAGRVAEGGVDAVGPLLGRVDELEAAGLELLVGGLAVVRGEEDRRRDALRDHAAKLLGGLLLEGGRPRDRHEHYGEV